MSGGQVHPQTPDWWKASDGLWYPPEAKLPPPPQKPQRLQPAIIPKGCNSGIELGCGLVLVLLVVLVLLAILL